MASTSFASFWSTPELKVHVGKMLATKHIVQQHVVLSFLFAFVLASNVLVVDEGYDPSEDYNPLDNYRPRNVTGLGNFHSWVGSQVLEIESHRILS